MNSESEKVNNQLEVSNYETETSISTLTTLIDTLGMIIESESIDSAIGNILSQFCNHINFPKGVFLVQHDDCFEMLSNYGFKKDIEIKKIFEKYNSLVWCTKDIGSSLIVTDIKKDKRFDENEVFIADKAMSVISYCLNINTNLYGMFLFYNDVEEQLFLRGALEKINRIAKIVMPHLDARQKNEIVLAEALKTIENEKNNAQKLLQIVGHDINNALAIIMGYCQLSAKSNEDNPSELKIWNIVKRASQTIAEIIETVRTMQTLEQKKMNISLESISLNEIVDKAKFIFESKLETKYLKISYDSTQDYLFQAEKRSFSNQVFNNIISNAIKFSNPRSEICVIAEELENEIHIEIQDTGIGMDEESLNNLFFSKKKTSRKGTQGEVGTGFGTDLVKSYIEMYGGRVEVESKDIETNPSDHGTIFHLYLRKKVARKI